VGAETAVQAYGSAQEVESGALLFGVGEATHDLILVDSGEAQVVRAATARAAEAVVAGFGAGQFVGELGLLTGQVTYLSGWVSQPGQLYRISPVSFRQLMDEDPDLSDVILRALMARRRYLRAGEAARSIEILGSEMSAGALALRTYTARQQLPHTWVEHEGGTLDTYLANYSLFHLEADLRWIDMTAARLDALAREVRK
jgi:thioredoxin reductase (NADPH)